MPIKGQKFWLWRAVDTNGDVLDILVQSRRDETAATRFFRKLIKKWGLARVLVPDAEILRRGDVRSHPGLEHRQHKGLNNRTEASHRHTRR